MLTPLVRQQVEDRARQNGISTEAAECGMLHEKQPTIRFTTVEQLGALAVFLCSPAADNLTGATLPVDGAWTAQ